MKILQLCKKFPYPLKDGESIAVTYLSKALQELGCEVSLLAMNTTKHFVDTQQLPKHFNHYKKIHTVKIDNRIKPLAALFNLFSSDSYHISRFISADYNNQLIKILQQEIFDVIHLETLYLAPYIATIRQYSSAKVVMRAHNVEHEIWERLSANASFFPKKWYLTHLTAKLKRYEIAQLQQYDALLAITQRDLDLYQSLGYKNDAKVLPIGLDIRDYTADNACFKHPLRLSFIGSLDWQPNIEGLEWFLKEVWAKINTQFPEVELHIAGRNTPDWLKKWNVPKVFVHGEVADAQAFINQYPIMLAPLLSGGGMRAKILEGMALGKVIISTTIGIEGIDISNGEEALIADTPDEFVNAIAYAYRLDEQLVDIGRRAQVFTAKKYDNYELSKGVLQFYKNLCGVAQNQNTAKILKFS